MLRTGLRAPLALGTCMMLCEWEVKLFIKPGLPKPEKIGDYQFNIDCDRNTYVVLRYSTNTFDEHHPDRVNNNEYAEQTLCREHTEKIEELLLMRMIQNSLFEPIEIVKEKEPELKNRVELERDGAKFRRRIVAYCEQRYGILDTNNTLSEAIQFFDKCKAIKTNKEFFIQIAKWLSKSEVSGKEKESFTILWTSFNTIFDICSTVRGKTREKEIQKIKGAINMLIDPFSAEQLLKFQKYNLNKLVSWNLISRNNTNCSNELQNCLNAKSIDHVLALINTLLCIYVLRNHIFHDGPRTAQIDEKAKVASDILKPFLAKCMHYFFKE